MSITLKIQVYKIIYTVRSKDLPRKKFHGPFRPPKEREILSELSMRCRYMGLKGLKNVIYVIAASEAEAVAEFRKKPRIPFRSYAEINDITLLSNDKTITTGGEK